MKLDFDWIVLSSSRGLRDIYHVQRGMVSPSVL